MRWNLTTMLRSAALILVAALSARADEVLSDELSAGWDRGFVTNDDCHGDCGLVCGCEPQTCYALSADLLWLGRGKVDPNFLIVAPANAPALSVLHTSELDFNVEAGIDMGLRGKRRNGQTWEVRYFGIFDQLARERRVYDDGDAVATNDAAIIHFDTLNGSYTDLTTAYSSDLQSGELNVWLCERWGFEPVVGFRALRQSEDLETFVTTDLTEGALIDFSNDLYGGQLGFRRVLWETPSRCRVEATLKGGVFYNDMKLDGEVRTGGATTPSVNRAFSSTAYGAELAVTAVYRFTPYLSGRIGYRGLWLDRVGLAADQIDDFSAATGAGNVDLATLIYQGGNVGLEVAW
ncbi:MAG: BBP7 family outer membrane beta-barrel protein [Planctomycetota bacterium]|nr:BBP7 family outer membrane beta-barrel protein [Planctomycetota bacterium]